MQSESAELYTCVRQVWGCVTTPEGFGKNSETVRLFTHNQTNMLIFNHNKEPEILVT